MSRSTGIARSTVQEYLRRVTGMGSAAEQLLALDDAALERRLFPSGELRDVDRPRSEWEMVERELCRRGAAGQARAFEAKPRARLSP